MAGAGGRIRLYLRGIALGSAPDLEEYAAGSDWISFGGQYQAPRDLPEMFKEIDLLWIASPYEDESRLKTDWRWKRTNRFYQACRFRKPMLAWKNTADGDEVEKLGVGMTVDPESPQRAAEAVGGISRRDLGHWRSNLAKLSRGVYTYTDEHRKLYRIIQGLNGSSAAGGTV